MPPLARIRLALPACVCLILLALPISKAPAAKAAAAATAQAVTPGAAPAAAITAHHAQVRIDAEGLDLNALVQRGYDVVEGKPGHSATIVATPADLQRLRADGFTFTVVHDDLEAFYAGRAGKAAGFGGFHTYSETLQKLDDLHAAYPTLTTARYSIGTTGLGNTLWAMKVSDNPNVDEDEPEVLFDGAHHAREPMGPEMCLLLIQYLCENYATDPAVKHLVDDREIVFVPIVNPDGYLYNETTNPNGGGMWRKNRRNNGSGIYGVDVNRNYPFQWVGSGSSTSPSAEDYRGPYAGSEPETQAMTGLMITHSFRIYMSYHTFSDLTMFPWGYTLIRTPDDAIFRDVGDVLVAGNGYVPGQAPEVLYQVNGSSIDWAYGEQTQKPKIFSFTSEMGNSEDGFWPADARIQPLFLENLAPALHLIDIAGISFFVRNLAVTGGDGNGQLDPGESATLAFTLQQGAVSEGAGNVQFKVATDDPYLTLPATQWTIGLMGARGTWATGGSPVPITVDAACPVNHVATLKLRVTWAGGARDLPLALPVGAATTLFADAFESGTVNWVRTGSWGLTTTYSHSASNSLTDSPSGNYTSNTSAYALCTTVFDFTHVARPALRYWTRFSTEQYYDFGRVEVSTDGTAWRDLDAVSGSQTTWEERIVPLTEYAGRSGVRLRFKFMSDQSVTGDGVYIDDVSVTGYPFSDQPPGVAAAVSPVGGVTVGSPTTLTVTNATDADGPDPLTYGFRIFSDAACTQLLASQAGVAEGPATTSWIVPAGVLGAKAQTPYWWRSYADDGASWGPLSPAAAFVFDNLTAVGDAPVAGPFLTAAPRPGGTAFRFALPRAGRATLAIYNLRGQRIASVFAGDVGGSGSAVWDQRDDRGSPVASGMYLAQLRGPETRLSVKVLVVR